MEIFGVYGLDTILIIVFAVFFYKAAEREGASRFLWTCLSIIVSLSSRILSLGLIGLILGQVALFFGIGIVRALISQRFPSRKKSGPPSSSS